MLPPLPIGIIERSPTWAVAIIMASIALVWLISAGSTLIRAISTMRSEERKHQMTLRASRDKELATAIERATRLQEGMKAQDESYLDRIGNLRASNATLTAQNHEFENEIRRLTAQNERLMAQSERLKGKLDAKDAQIGDLTAQMVELSARIALQDGDSGDMVLS